MIEEIEETEEQIPEAKNYKPITLDMFYEELAIKRTYYFLNHKYSQNTTVYSDNIELLFQEIYEKFSDQKLQINLTQINEAINSRDLIGKLYTVEFRIENYIFGLRYDIYKEIYGHKPTSEEAYYYYKGEKYENYYTKAIDQQLIVYFNEYIEKLIDTKAPAEFIEIVKHKGKPKPSVDSKTDHLRDILQSARGEEKVFERIFGVDVRTAKREGKVFEYKTDLVHFQKFAYQLVKSHMKIVRERVESVSLKQEWQAESQEVMQARIDELREKKKEEDRKAEAEDRIIWQKAAKREREGVFYYLPESVKSAGREVKEVGAEIKEEFVNAVANIGATGYSLLNSVARINKQTKKEADYFQANKDFLAAARKHDKKHLFKALKAGANPFIRDDKGNSALKLLDKSTQITLIGYMLSFVMRRPEYELYYELKLYMAVYSLAVKRVRAKYPEMNRAPNILDIVEEVDTIYNTKRVTTQKPTYTKEALEDTSLIAYHRASMFGYILSFAKQVNAYKENNYYHVRDGRVEYARKASQSNVEIHNVNKPKPSERLGYNTHKFACYTGEKASSFREAVSSKANYIAERFSSR
ncbi:MAG: hypothetical protein ACK4OM_02085 [Alphaproteobacteria bacterium]